MAAALQIDHSRSWRLPKAVRPSVRPQCPTTTPKKERREWCILDTFDMFSPAYDQPQNIRTIQSWFKELGFKNIFAGQVKYNSHFAAVTNGTKCA